jgi:adenine-specific DNA-methyltransferase
VLDAFGGSGTTGAVAEELGRRWVMMDSSPLAMETMVKRLAHGTQPMGDFVKKGKKGKRAPVQGDLMARVLTGGLELYIDEGSGVEPIHEDQLHAWAEILHGEVIAPATLV